MKSYFAHPTAIIDEPSEIGEGTKIWHYSHVREGCVVGKNCNIGQNCYIDNGVIIGDNVKIQNGVSVYKGVVIEDNVFIGPNATFTNDKHPSAVGKWHITETLVCQGASIGANATIVCGVCIGEKALIGAGAVVCKNVIANTVVVGNPARVLKTENKAVINKLKIGVIGAGKMGQFHILKAVSNKEIELIGFYDVNEKTVSTVQKKHPNIKYFSTTKELLKAVDAVIIASPSPYHYEHATEALLSDVHVLCEKPLTTDYETSKRIIEIAKKRNLILQPGQVERYNPSYKALKQQLPQTNIISIETARTGGYSNKHSKTSIVYDLLVHDIDLISYLLQEDYTVQSVWGKTIHSQKTDIVYVTLKSESGILVSLLASRVTEQRNRVCKIHAVGQFVEADFMNKTIITTLPCENNELNKDQYFKLEQQTKTWVVGKDQLQNQLESFVNAVTAKKPLISYKEMDIVARVLSEIEKKLN